LEALWEAGGFPDARTWFLTGHTVAEVYFDGKYSMLDSDMLGYTTVGSGDPRSCPIASVRQLEENERIILDKMLAADKADSSKVVDPWYPADVRAKAMGGYAGIFTSNDDNWLFPFRRFPSGHTMDFELRPGEKMIRHFEPESEGLFYLPFKRSGEALSEFPREVERWKIKTEDGPHSQKDSRLWGTGRIEYRPELASRNSYYPLFSQNLKLPSNSGGPLQREDKASPAVAVFEMPSPYVIINADFELDAVLETAAHQLMVATSTDRGKSWEPAGSLIGPFQGSWRIGAAALAVGDHGVATAVSGKYGYLVRLALSGPSSGEALVNEVAFRSLVQLNPRTLPALEAGENKLAYVPGSQRKKWNLPVDLSRLAEFVTQLESVEYIEEESNGFLVPQKGASRGEIIFEVAAPDDANLQSVSAGGRFLILNELGPEKLTAETRATSLRQDLQSANGSLAWSLEPAGPWNLLWEFSPPSEWFDNEPIERLLVWPEVDEEIGNLPAETKKVYLRYLLEGLALDDVRMSAFTDGVTSEPSTLKITHHWYSRGSKMSQSVEIEKPDQPFDYVVRTNPFDEIENRAVVFECVSNP
jgi:hypothetical protein